MAILNILFNNELLDAIPLHIGESCIIGRDTDSDVVIDQLVVSFHHAIIESHGKGFLLVDLHSENGTFLNGKEISSVWLNDGDTITVGNHKLIFSNTLNIAIPDKMQNCKLEILKKSITETIPMDAEKIDDLLRRKNLRALNELGSKNISSMVLVLLPDHRKLLPLGEKPITLGKAQTNDIVVKDLWVAEKAGIIEKLADGWYLRYVGGFLRPKVNGEFSKKPMKLKEFDIISLGKSRMQVMQTHHMSCSADRQVQIQGIQNDEYLLTSQTFSRESIRKDG